MSAFRRVVLLPLAVLSIAACSSGVEPVVVPALVYDEGAAPQALSYQWPAATDPYLVQLNARYEIAKLAVAATSDLGRAEAISRWVHTRFAHDGANASKYTDPMGILDEAATGKRMRCVEYAAVTSGALSSIGIPTRMVWLLTSTEGTRTDGTAHVVAEAYLRDVGRWVMVDAQWDAIPVRAGQPLSALQLQRALANGATDIVVHSRSGMSAGGYLPWIAPYLHYFYTRLDARIGVNAGSAAIILAPVGDQSLGAKYPPPANLLSPSIALFYPTPAFASGAAR